MSVSVRESITCVSCIYFKSRKLYSKPCIDLGYLDIHPSCSSYEPDVTALRSHIGSDNQVKNLISAIRDIPENEASIVAYLLICKTRITRYTKYRFLEPVYLKYYGDGGYLSHYCKAYILDATSSEVRCISVSNTIVASIPTSSKSSILTIHAFQKVRNKIAKLGNIVDPEQQRSTRMSALGRMANLDDVHKDGGSKWKMSANSKKIAAFIRRKDEKE